jgi:O-antigen/teichoic acid export membrane protein
MAGQGNVGRSVLINSASGYLRTLLRLLLGVLSFRMVCARLGSEELGFYGLAWSLLAYGSLLDFGFGVAVQKNTAALSTRGDWDRLGRLLSSVLICNAAIGAILFGVGVLGAGRFLHLVGVSPENLPAFRRTLLVFLGGMALLTPLELSREMLYGLRRIALADQVTAALSVVSFGLLVWLLRRGAALWAVIGAQMACMVLTSALLTVLALRALPEVRLRPSFFSWSTIREVTRFSIPAHICLLTNALVAQTDRLLISALLSVSVVAVFHMGAKISELFWSFAQQLPNVLSPEAARLHGAGDRAEWQRLFARGLRTNAMIATPLFLLCAFFLEGLLDFLTHGHVRGQETYQVGRLLLLWSYSSVLTHAVPRTMFMMSGYERRLLGGLGVEALGNFTLSAALLWRWQSPLGAAVGSLVPALVMGWLWLFPWAAREAGMTTGGLVREALAPVFLGCLPLAAFGLACRTVPALEFRTSFVTVLVEGAIGAMLAIAGLYRFALSDEERSLITGRVALALGRQR